jgi:hypothetical protein
MENRVLASILLFALFFPNYTFAYDPPTTHAGLTQESVNFYNLYHGDNKISKENLEKIVLRTGSEITSVVFNIIKP